MNIRKNLRRVTVAVMLLVAFLSQGTWALAGTTGGLAGSVVDQAGKPVAGAKITAASASETTATKTDGAGHFSFVSLTPDTYTLQVEKDTFEPTSLTGVVVYADNSQTLTITLQSALKTIARVTSRAASSLVKASTTGDVYSVNQTVASQTGALGGGGSLNQAYSALASVPGVFIPQGQSGWAQSVFIRGSNYTQLGYEYDGVPIQRAFDQYPSGTLSSLGQQELQVYAGAGPTDAQSSAIGGFINQVIKTGTYPGTGLGDLGYGLPTFYSKLAGEAGGASPDRLFSYYLGVGGFNQGFRYYDNFNGRSLDPNFGTNYNLIAQNCATAAATVGCYTNTIGNFGVFPNGPTGFATGPTFYSADSANFNRDLIANFHFAIPHKRDGGRDDIQFLSSNTFLRTQFQEAFADWNYAQTNVLDGTAVFNGAGFNNCSTVAAGAPCALLGPNPFSYTDRINYGGPVGEVLTPAMLSQTVNYLQPNSPTNRNYAAQTPLNERDFYSNNFNVEKLQYQKNFGTTAFARIYGYTSYSDWLQTALSGSTINCNFCGAVSPNYELITHTFGAAMTLADQLSEKHLLNLTAGYTEASTIRWNNTWYAGAPNTVAVAVDSTNPTNGICYNVGAAVTPVYCAAGGAAGVSGYAVPPLPSGPIGAPPSLVPNAAAAANGVSIANIGAFTCGAGPCEFF